LEILLSGKPRYMPNKASDFDYDVALSFAGEDRAIAQEIARSLNDRNIRVFYDRFEESGIWGKNLYDYLAEIYSTRAMFCLMIISRHYPGNSSTIHERQHAQARAFTEDKEYILPVRLDDTEVPGIASTVAYIDYRTSSAKKIAELLERKLSASRTGNDSRAVTQRITAASETLLLNLKLTREALDIIAEKSDGWECGLFLEVLQEEIELAQGLKLDLQYGIVTGKVRLFEIPEFFKWSAAHIDLLDRQTEAFQRLAQEGLQVVLGPQKEDGNAAAICLIGRKLGALYKWSAEWGTEFRTASVNDNFTNLLNLYAKAGLILIEVVEELHRRLKSSYDEWRSLDEDKKAVHEATIEVSLPSPNAAEIRREIERLRKLYKW
jgi:hypothetical protein